MEVGKRTLGKLAGRWGGGEPLSLMQMSFIK